MALLGAPLFAAPAHDYRFGDIEIVHPWARATAARARNDDAYLTLSNQGAEVDHLLGVATAMARKARLHGHIDEDGIVKMRPVKAIEVEIRVKKAGATRPSHHGHGDHADDKGW